jgi:flavin reductase (DIM6/NTAB) family NADH-FMN oxidoreductase RutF
MYFDISRLDARHCYKLLASSIVPRPIAWIVTCDPQGRSNAAPFSFFNVFSGSPPVICVGMGNRDAGPKDSLDNIRKTQEFVINLVSEELAQAMNITAIHAPPGVNELEMAQLATVPSTKVKPARIERSPVALECRLRQILEVDAKNAIVVADVVAVHIRDDAVTDPQECRIDTARLQLVGRMESPGGYVHTADRFTMRTPSYEEWLQSSGNDKTEGP